MDEFTSWRDDATSHGLEPEIESMMVIIENSSESDSGRVGWIQANEILESCTRFQTPILYFFEYESISYFHILDISCSYARDY